MELRVVHEILMSSFPGLIEPSQWDQGLSISSVNSSLFSVGDYGGGRAEVGGGLAMETVLPVDDFQSLGGDQQSEEIFRLLSLLSPFAGEVTGLKTSIDTALTRIR